MFLLTLDKVLHIEQDLENIKSFMAIKFEKELIKKADKKTAKKLINKKLNIPARPLLVTMIADRPLRASKFGKRALVK